MNEQRRFHRMKIHLPVSLEIEHPPNFIAASTVDISTTGLAVSLKEAVQQGQVVAISINITDQKIVKLDAQVMWVKEVTSLHGDREYRAGLKIVDKMGRDEIEFIRYVAQQMVEYFKT